MFKKVLPDNSDILQIGKKQNKLQFINLLFEEYIYLIVLSLFLLFYSMQTIQYPIEWTRLNYNYIHTFLFVYVFFKYTFMDRTVFGITEGIVAFLLLFSFFISNQHTGYAELFDTALLILGAKNVSYAAILKIYLIVKLPFILATIIGSQLGIIENLIYNQNGRIRESFGFVYPTDFAAQVFFLITAWTLFRKMQLSFYELTGMILVALFLKIKCDTRCSVLSILLIVCGALCIKVKKKRFVNCHISSLIERGIQLVCIVAPYVFSSTMILACRFYDPENPIFAAINKLTTQRLKLGKKTFDYYDVKLFGQYIEMQGNGGTTQKPLDYTFIDCSYISILMRYGLFVFIIIMLLISFLMLRNYQNIIVIGLVTLICLHSMIEQHLFEIHYNFTLLLAFSSLHGDTNALKTRLCRKNRSPKQ